jgi:tRNA threonylcarbamoyladenosine biosynthesis protein TsaE
MYASNLAEMQQAANTFLKLFPNGGHFAVYGEMGAGKTTFIHCVCKALNLPFAGSPTFSLVNEYVLPNGHKMYHFDLYRLNSAEELRTIGFEEYIESGYYIFIEWPQIASAFTKKMHGLTITDNHELRTIEL